MTPLRTTIISRARSICAAAASLITPGIRPAAPTTLSYSTIVYHAMLAGIRINPDTVRIDHPDATTALIRRALPLECTDIYGSRWYVTADPYSTTTAHFQPLSD